MVTLFQSLYTLSFVSSDRVSGRLKTLKDDERGASAVEYALLVGLIAIAVVGAVALFKPMLEDLFTNIEVNPEPPTTPAGS